MVGSRGRSQERGAGYTPAAGPIMDLSDQEASVDSRRARRLGVGSRRQRTQGAFSTSRPCCEQRGPCSKLQNGPEEGRVLEAEGVLDTFVSG